MATSDAAAAAASARGTSPGARESTWLGRLNPLAIILVGYLFGGLLVGGDAIQPAGIPLMIQGIILFCVISAETFTRYRVRLAGAQPAPVATKREA